jgi:hypothetical protein
MKEKISLVYFEIQDGDALCLYMADQENETEIGICLDRREALAMAKDIINLLR